MAVIPGVADGELIRTSWGDAVADELNSNVVKITGSTMTGGLHIEEDNALTMYGSSPSVQFYNAAGTTSLGYIQTLASSVMDFEASAGFRFRQSGTVLAAIAGGRIFVGADAFLGTTAGATLEEGGSIGSLRTSNAANVRIYKASAAFVNGGVFTGFYGQTDATVLGTITQNGSSAVLYNTSSDYRLKDELGPIDDPVDRLMQLQPKHLRWKVDHAEFDGFIAHEVDEVVPYAVTGVKDAVRPTDDDIDPGGIIPQQLDSGQLIPLLTAALQDAHTKIADLTARLEALEAAEWRRV